MHVTVVGIMSIDVIYLLSMIMCSMQDAYSTKVDQYEQVFCASAQGDRKYMEDYVVLDESEAVATGQTFMLYLTGTEEIQRLGMPVITCGPGLKVGKNQKMI